MRAFLSYALVTKCFLRICVVVAKHLALPPTAVIDPKHASKYSGGKTASTIHVFKFVQLLIDQLVFSILAPLLHSRNLFIDDLFSSSFSIWLMPIEISNGLFAR